jgi:outer membrane protein OmpA-like peptidoglycan-associated protein
MRTPTPFHPRLLALACTVSACSALLACGQSGKPPTALTPRTEDRKSPVDVQVQAAQTSASASPSVRKSLSARPVCPLITAAEMGTLLGATIGNPAEKVSADSSSCLYPPADAGSNEQANINIAWNHGPDLSPEKQLASALSGAEPGLEVAHNSALGDESTYSIDGVLSIRSGQTLISIELPMRPDSEDKAVAVARLLLSRLGVPDPRVAATGAAATPAYPDGLHVGEPCPEVTGDATAAESALVPLKVGLTLSNIWNGGDDNYDHECLVQIVGIGATYIDITHSCPRGADHHTVSNKRRICRAAMQDSYFYRSETSQKEPPVVSPVTMFSLSTRSLRELKTNQSTRHRYIEIDDDWSSRAQPLDRDVDEVLSSTRFDREPYSVTVNGRQVDLPTVVAIGGGNHAWQTSVKVLDDERFPLALVYEIPGYRLKTRYTKISYPTQGEMEKQLAIDKHVDVYGIYFDFASDRIRPESIPILEEIAGLMKHNPDWRLSINGHTDNVGGDASNLQLSRQRAKAVKAALVDRYGISDSRLNTGGFGASQPHEKNDTPEGRSRNRRVELTRQ